MPIFILGNGEEENQMGSVKGANKQLTCIVCGDIFTGSLYANAKTAKCPQCKKVGKKVGNGNPVIHDAGVQAISQAVMSDRKPTKVILYRNRQDIESDVVMNDGEILSRIPATWKIINNELDYISISKISTYQQCPKKFHDQYMVNISGKDEDHGNIFTWFGSILHEVMEVTDKAWMENGIALNPLVCYDEAWRKRELTDLSMYKEGRQLITEYFNVHPIGQSPFKILSTEVEWRGKLSEIIDNVPEELKDMHFGCQIDYIGEIDENTAILKDYKSNRHPYTQLELEDSLQLQVYELVARKLYPQYTRWITGYEMFRFGWQQCPQRSKEDLDAIGAYVINVGMQVVRDNIWKGKLNDLCGYCDGRWKCETYCGFLNDPKRGVDLIKTDKTDMAKINEDRETLTAMEKIIKKRKDELSDIMKKSIEQAVINGEQFVVGDKEYYLQAQSRPSYNYYAVKNVMAMSGKINELEGCVSINKTKLDAIAKSDPQLAMELSRCMDQAYSAPYLMAKKAKIKK